MTPLSTGWTWNRPRVAAFAGVGVAVLVVAVAVIATVAQRGEARPGTRLDGVDVGGLDRAAILVVAEDVARERKARVLTVEAGDRTTQVRARTLGVKVDPAASTEAALDARRGGVTGLFHGLTSLFGADHDVAPVAELRESRLTNATGRVVGELSSRPSNGGFTVDVSDEEPVVRVDPPRVGVTLDRAVVTDQLRDALLAGRAETVELSAVVDPPEAGMDAAREVTTEARQLLTADFVLDDGERDLTLSPSALGPSLRAELDGQGGLRLGVDPVKLRATVEDEAEPLTKAARKPRLTSPSPGVLLTAKGDASFEPRRIATTVREGRPGYRVDVDAAVTAIAAAVAEGRRTADLPGRVIPVPSAEGDLSRVDQVIGSFTTYFPCCAPRVRNINRMAEIVDGTVVPPGKTFSLNGVVGQRTVANGFVEDGAIVGDRIEMQVGGGVSQFSTTLLNAVWFAGLPSLQHQPHTAYISRYPAVREATLDYGNIDNLWRNETKHPIVVRTVATGTSVTVALYGHTGDRKVTSTTSPRQPKKGGGFKATVSRTVRDGGQVVKQDGLSWTYRGPLKTEAEIKKEEAAKKKAAEKKKQQKKSTGSKPSASSSPRASASR